MSEYQYYEFQAIDRTLSGPEMAKLRESSSRARITPSSFINEYSYGDFRGKTDTWMEKYFDAFLYLANWGTHTLKLRLPVRMLSPETARVYCVGEQAAAHGKDVSIVLTFESNDEGGDGWEDDGNGLLASILPVRAELIDGDLRALYLGWLLCAQDGDLDDDALEPDVPAGLGQLGGPLESFAEFLRIDPALIAAAAASSPPQMEAEPASGVIRAWVERLPTTEKDTLLERVIAGDPALARKLRQRMKSETANAPNRESRPAKRSVADLRQAADLIATESERAAKERAAKKKAQAEGEAAAARRRHLDSLKGRESTLWKEIEDLLAGKQSRSYPQIVAILVDLRDLATPANLADFRRRLSALKLQHRSKAALLSRIDKNVTP